MESTIGSFHRDPVQRSALALENAHGSRTPALIILLLKIIFIRFTLYLNDTNEDGNKIIDIPNLKKYPIFKEAIFFYPAWAYK